MNFLNDGDPNYKTRIGLSKIAESTTTTIAPIKLRNFTEEQKAEIRERVKQIRQEREEFQLSQAPGHRFGQKRTLLKSGGSQFPNLSTSGIARSDVDEPPIRKGKHILTL